MALDIFLARPPESYPGTPNGDIIVVYGKIWYTPNTARLQGLRKDMEGEEEHNSSAIRPTAFQTCDSGDG